MRIGVLLAVIAGTLATFALKPSSGALADTMYTELFLEQGMEQHLSCAATIMALGEGSELSYNVGVFFVEDAAVTLQLYGGWKDKDAASARAVSLATDRAFDLAPLLEHERTRAELVQKQGDCILGRFR